MSDKEQLISFGFPESKVIRALKATKNSGLQSALDWLQNHADDPEPLPGQEDNDEMKVDENDDEEGAPGGAAEAKSLKCLECGKVFRNNALASYHGEKSGHDQFEESTEEIKPLTEQEKADKLQELKQRMQEKKAQKAKLDIEESKSNERMRRKGGQDESVAKAELALKEANKDALIRKQDKIDDAKAKAQVRASIAADKQARLDKVAKEKAFRAGLPPPVTTTPTPIVTVAPALKEGEKKVYDTTRLQIRLPGGGAPLVTTLAVKSTLKEVGEWVKSQASGAGMTEVVFSSTFPRKNYGAEDENKTLEELGLVPSAVLIIS